MSETKEETQVVNQTLRITSKESPADQRNKCCKCEKVFKSKDKSVTCGTCQQTFHAKCQNVSDKKYETLKEEGDDTLWLCLSCNQVTRGMVQNIVSIQQRVSTLEEDMASKADRSEVQQLGTRLNNFMQGAKNRLETKADKNKMEDLSNRLSTIEQRVNNDSVDKDTEELSKLLDEKLKEQQEIINQRRNQQGNSTEKSMSDAMKEMEDRDRRKHNIVVHNISESEEVEAEARKSHDEEMIKKLFKEHLRIDVQPKLDSNQKPMMYRLGKKTDGKSRSLKITLLPDDVPKVLKNAKKLSLATDANIKKIVIKPDLTPMQREEEQKLVKEKNEKNKEALSKNERADWIIQRWKVVRRPAQAKVPQANATTSTSSLAEEFTDATADATNEPAKKE